MRRASKICPHVARDGSSCTHVQPCPDHGTSGQRPWAGSSRRQRSTLSGSQQQKRARFVIDRGDTICHVCGYPGANEADHVVALAAGGSDTVENMAPIHAVPCHRDKTAREAQAARAA